MPIEDDLNNRIRMVNGVTTFIDADTAPYSGISQVPVVNGDVKTKMTVVNGLNLVAGGTTKGVKADVGNVRKAMEQLADKLAKGTFAFATATNNNELKQIVNWTDSKLSRLQKEDVDDKCEAICNAASANAAALVAYGISAGDITAAIAAVAAYRPLTGKVKMTKVTINNAKAQMQEVVSGIISFELKGQLDGLIGTLKMTNKAYYEKYFGMRKVDDLANTHAKMRMQVRDEDTDAFLDDVTFKMYKVGEPDVYKQGVTKDKGTLSISEVDVADYDFEWSKVGYITYIEGGVHIAAGQEIQRKKKMKVGTGVQGGRAVVN
jgi:hypothetical protein